MSVALQPLDVSFEEPEPAEPEPAEPAEPEPAGVPESINQSEGAPSTGVVSEPPPPKKRGRPPKVTVAPGLPPPPAQRVPQKPPPKAPKPKAKPKVPPPSESDSDVDETLRNVYNHVAKPSMETAVLEYLVNRQQGEKQRRRQLWSQLAKM